MLLLLLFHNNAEGKAKQSEARPNGVLTKFTIGLSFMHFKCDNLTGFWRNQFIQLVWERISFILF